MANLDIKEVNPDELADLSSVRFQKDKPRDERIVDYLNQVKNPYLFTVNGIAIKITFTGKRKMQDCMKECLFGQE